MLSQKNEYRLSPTVHFVTDCNSMHQKLSCWYSSLTHSIDFTFLNTFTSKRSAHVFVLLLAYYQRAKESKTVSKMMLLTMLACVLTYIRITLHKIYFYIKIIETPFRDFAFSKKVFFHPAK